MFYTLAFYSTETAKCEKQSSLFATYVMLEKISMYRAEHEYFFSVMSELVFLVNPLEQLSRKKHSSFLPHMLMLKNLCVE
jgi:hypothetical protein